MPKRASNAAVPEPPLVEWDEPGPQLDVLDWRRRAGDWGLTAIDGEHGVAEPADPAAMPAPDDLLVEEESEAIWPQQLPEADQDKDEHQDDEPPEDGLRTEDADPVRAYLRQIGRTPLLTADQERQIGSQIELARTDLQAAIARIPCAVKCLTRLADRVRAGEAPA